MAVKRKITLVGAQYMKPDCQVIPNLWAIVAFK